MAGNSAMERYKTSLAGLCFYCARLAHLKEMKTDGEVIDEKEIEQICEHIKYGMEDLLDVKKTLGYEDGLEFIEDTLFAGFAIKDGIVTGDLKNVPLIASPWYHNFPEKGNNYQFEVANYLFAFLEEDRKVKRQERRKSGCNYCFNGWIKKIKRRMARHLPCFIYNEDKI